MSFFSPNDTLGGAAVLGEKPDSEAEFVHRIESGLPVKAINRLTAFGEFTADEMAQIIPRRTLTHLRERKKLTAEQSDRIARVASVFALAQAVFANRGKANRWMREANRALEGATPLSLLRTGTGATLVGTILIRLAAGVYS